MPRPTLSAVAVASLFASINPAFAADGDVITPPTLSAVDVVGRSASGAYYADDVDGGQGGWGDHIAVCGEGGVDG
ncbi:MAG: hypothetical protein EON54_09405, partial [Alcaligenaceae bacterium]